METHSIVSVRRGVSHGGKIATNFSHFMPNKNVPTHSDNHISLQFRATAFAPAYTCLAENGGEKKKVQHFAHL